MRRVTFAAMLLVAAGCHRGARSPEEAFRATERAIAAADGAALYPFLDRATRWSVDSTFKDQQLMRTIIEGKYPDEEQARALAPLAAAAEPNAARFFARVARQRQTLERLRQRLGSVSGPIVQRPDGADAAWVARQDGAPLHFVHDPDGSWGFSELAAEWALEKDRANHAVSTVRENAKLYEKAEK